MDLNYPQNERCKLLKYLGLRMIEPDCWTSAEGTLDTPLQKTLAHVFLMGRHLLFSQASQLYYSMSRKCVPLSYNVCNKADQFCHHHVHDFHNLLFFLFLN